MATLLVIVNILLILVAIILIVCVLMQEGNRAGLGAIGGGAETFFGKTKAKGVQGKLELITKVGAGVFIVLAIVATAMTAKLNPITPATSAGTEINLQDLLDGETVENGNITITPIEADTTEDTTVAEGEVPASESAPEAQAEVPETDTASETEEAPAA